MRKNERKNLISAFKAAENNMKWLIENYHRLKVEYGDSWVAVRDGGVVSYNKEYEVLLETLKDISLDDLQTIAIDFISRVLPNFLL